MRWFVSRNGESSGPHEEALVAQWARDGQLGSGAMLRDEAASAWVPLAQTPFAEASPSATRPMPPTKETPRTGCLLVVVGVLFIVFFIVTRNDRHASISAVTEAPQKDPEPLTTVTEPAPALRAPGKTEAWVMSKVFVTTALKSPSSADFGGILDQSPNCSSLDDGSWKCEGWVDAQNSFGAQIRNLFAITIRWGGKDDWADPRSWSIVAGPTLTAR